MRLNSSVSRGARLGQLERKPEPQLWVDALRDVGVDFNQLVHQKYELIDRLPWDHLNVKYGRTFLEKEQIRSTDQLGRMAAAVATIPSVATEAPS